MSPVSEFSRDTWLPSAQKVPGIQPILATISLEENEDDIEELLLQPP